MSTPLPTTSISDALSLLGVSLGFAGLRFGLGFLGVFRDMETRHLLGYLERYRSSSRMDFYSALNAVKAFYRLPSSFLMLWFPFLVFCSGGVWVSLLRDSGVQVAPWAVWIHGASLGILWPLMEILKYRRMVKMAVAR